MRPGWIIAIIVIVAVLFAVLYGSLCAVRTRVVYFDNFTGSTSGSTRWIGGLEVDRWETTSAFEHRLEAMPGVTVVHDPVTVEGTGLTLFGAVVSRGHGRPTEFYTLSRMIERGDMLGGMDDVTVLRIYAVARSKDDQAIRERTERLMTGSR